MHSESSGIGWRNEHEGVGLEVARGNSRISREREE